MALSKNHSSYENPDYQSQPRFFLPPEIWVQIFHKLESFPDDFLSVINTSQQWRELLQSKRTTVLLPLILPTSLEAIDVPADAQLWNIVLSWRGLAPSAKIWVDQILSVEATLPTKYYQRVSERSEPIGNWHGRSNFLRLTNFADGRQTRLSSPQDVQNFASHFALDLEAKANPFVTKHVVLNLTPDFSNEEERSLLNVMKQYGNNIFALTLNIMPRRLLPNSLPVLLELFRYVPNLKILRINGFLGIQGVQDIFPYQIRRADVTNLKNLELLDLEVIDLTSTERFNLASIILELYGSHIRTLICRRELIEHGDVPFLNASLPNLRCLRVGTVSSTLLETLSQLQWPLEELQFVRFTWLLYPTITSLLRAINNFSRTLNHLHLRVGWYNADQPQARVLERIGEDNMEMAMETLPKLTTLSLRPFIIERDWFLNVMLAKCPKLKELRLTRALNEVNIIHMKEALQNKISVKDA
ncbi:hypothetical protein Ocin01_16279, partial [Orchesella cincta]